MDKISVIIPVYNVEKYIKTSVESVLNQTYSNLEIILVDDGTEDNCDKICDEYKEKDDRVVVIHQKNMGLAEARNSGMKIATGKYIMFLDSDDFFEKNSCEVLYNEIKKRDADFVIGNYIHVDTDGNKWENPLFDQEIYTNFQLSIKDYQKSFFVMNSVVWNKIYKREFLEKINLKFVKGTLAEDAIFSTFCYVHSNNGYFINDIVYNYRQNQANSTISTTCSKKYFEKIDEAYKLIFNNFESTNNIGFYRYFYARIMPYLLCKIIDSDALEKEEDKIDVIKMLEWFFKQKEEYDVYVVNEMLNDIVNDILDENYDNVLEKIRKVQKYRKEISSVKAEKMYAPSQEIYKNMSKNDYKY